MADKVKIASAGNTVVPAYLSLLEKGYRVSRRACGDREETWQAVKGNQEFIAEDTLSLLGLVALFEVRGVNWRAADDEIGTFLSQFP
jgi:hypothetical protein